MALLSAVAEVGAASFVYLPPDNATAPYNWSTVANWANVNSTPRNKPTVWPGTLPSSGDIVYVSDDTKLPTDPLHVSLGDTISIGELHIASGSVYGLGMGTKFEMSGGSLTTSSNASFFNGDYAYGSVRLTGGTMTIGGAGMIGYNPNTAQPATFFVGEDASLTVSGALVVGRRSTKYGTFVTNVGEIAVGSLVIGNDGNTSFDGTGVVYNAGILRSSGNVTIGQTRKTDAAYDCLILAENSEFSFGSSGKLQTSSSSGTQVFDTSIDIVCGEGQTVEFNGKNAVARFRKNAKFVANSKGSLYVAESGKCAKLELFDNAAIVLTNELRFANQSAATGILAMHDHSCVSNVDLLLGCGPTTGSRKDSRLEIEMGGDSAIHFGTNGPTRRIALTNRNGSSGDIALRERSRIDGLRQIYSATDFATNSLSLRLEGGTVEFYLKPGDSSSSYGVQLGSSKNAGGLMSISGYGAMTRSDVSNPDNTFTMGFLMQGPNWNVTADGMGGERTLDLRAFGATVSGSYMANRSGTNGWRAVSKGKLVFPRQKKEFGSSSSNPARFVGDVVTPGIDAETGDARLPTHVNAFSLRPSGVNGSIGYAYGELYAPDRTDYPSLASCAGANAVVMSVWRVGTDSATWTHDEPSSHCSFATVKLVFRYDVDAVPRDGVKRDLVLFRHTGAADGRWVRVGGVAADEALSAETVATDYLTPTAETWDIGWFALVARPKQGLVMVFR